MKNRGGGKIDDREVKKFEGNTETVSEPPPSGLTGPIRYPSTAPNGPS